MRSRRWRTELFPRTGWNHCSGTMARNNARWGRLRRVLAEDLTANAATDTFSAGDLIPGDTPRYGIGANIENHPQITDYVPRKLRSMAWIVVLGLVLCGGAGYLAEHAAPIAATTSTGLAERDLLTISENVVAWTSAVVLLIAAVYAHVIYLLKRHRIDDVKGRYRVWRAVQWLAIALSANSVISLHEVWGKLAGHATGWHLLADDKGWWLLPVVLIGTVVIARLVVDVAECRTALTSLLIAIACWGVAGFTAMGVIEALTFGWSEPALRCLPLAGYLFFLTGCLLTARYVVLDVQGLIEHKDRGPFVVADSHHTSDACDQANAESGARKVAREETIWVDGSEPDETYTNDRPLSKAERKRLRKQKRRHAA